MVCFPQESRRMILAHHLIWSAYACWLPNDPRGSSSNELRFDLLQCLGELYPGRKEVQPSAAALRVFYRQADDLLSHRRYLLTDRELPVLAEAIAATIVERAWTCHAAALMPDHVHLLIRRHTDRAETMLETLQKESKAKLIKAGLRPVNHPVWGGKGWKVFLDSPERIVATAEYIRRNPLKWGLPEQKWWFVTKYEG
jgi:REP element-mobilizing transposase RayT